MSIKTQEILDGLREGNEPSEYDGVKGYWCQADCIFIPADDPALAVQKYRESFSSGGPFNIGVGHNDGCGSIAFLKLDNKVLKAAGEVKSIREKWNKGKES